MLHIVKQGPVWYRQNILDLFFDNGNQRGSIQTSIRTVLLVPQLGRVGVCVQVLGLSSIN